MSAPRAYLLAWALLLTVIAAGCALAGAWPVAVVLAAAAIVLNVASSRRA